MPNIIFDNEGNNGAQDNSLTIDNGQLVQITNFTDSTVRGIFNVSATSNFIVLETNNRGPRGAEVLNELAVGVDPDIRLQPGGTVILHAQAASVMNVQANDVSSTHKTSAIDGQYVYIALLNATT